MNVVSHTGEPRHRGRKATGYDPQVTLTLEADIVRAVDDLARTDGCSRAGIWRELIDQGYRIAVPEDRAGLGLPTHKQRARPKPLKIAVGKPARPVTQPGLFEGFDVREIRPGRQPCGKIKTQTVGVVLPARALKKVEEWGEAHCLPGCAAPIKKLIFLALNRRCPSLSVEV